MALMDETPETESGEAEQPAPRSIFKDIAGWLAGTVRARLAALGLFLFMAVMSALVVAYPAYLVSARLFEYAAANTQEAELVSIDVRTVELGQDRSNLFEARKHFDVVFHFKDAQNRRYASVQEMSWPAPGLKRRLLAEHPPGETFVLYHMPDQSLVMDAYVARSAAIRLTLLMALVLVATVMVAMLWHRLAVRMPEKMPAYPTLGMKSFLWGQGVALVVAGALAMLANASPRIVAWPLYLGAYWAVVVLVSLTLRLLVLAPSATPVPPPVEVQTKAGAQSLRRSG